MEKAPALRVPWALPTAFPSYKVTVEVIGANVLSLSGFRFSLSEWCFAPSFLDSSYSLFRRSGGPYHLLQEALPDHLFLLRFFRMESRFPFLFLCVTLYLGLAYELICLRAL